MLHTRKCFKILNKHVTFHKVCENKKVVIYFLLEVLNKLFLRNRVYMCVVLIGSWDYHDLWLYM